VGSLTISYLFRVFMSFFLVGRVFWIHECGLKAILVHFLNICNNLAVGGVYLYPRLNLPILCDYTVLSSK